MGRPPRIATAAGLLDARTTWDRTYPARKPRLAHTRDDRHRGAARRTRPAQPQLGVYREFVPKTGLSRDRGPCVEG